MAYINAKCPLCGQSNTMSEAYCERCNYRLPWADEVEGLPARQHRPSTLENKVDAAMNRLGIAPTIPVTCRFCNQPIERDATRCPHCGESLVGSLYYLALDPWQPNYDDRAAKRTGLLSPRGGCLSLPLLLLLAALKTHFS